MLQGGNALGPLERLSLLFCQGVGTAPSGSVASARDIRDTVLVLGEGRDPELEKRREKGTLHPMPEEQSLEQRQGEDWFEMRD